MGCGNRTILAAGAEMWEWDSLHSSSVAPCPFSRLPALLGDPHCPFFSPPPTAHSPRGCFFPFHPCSTLGQERCVHLTCGSFYFSPLSLPGHIPFEQREKLKNVRISPVKLHNVTIEDTDC